MGHRYSVHRRNLFIYQMLAAVPPKHLSMGQCTNTINCNLLLPQGLCNSQLSHFKACSGDRSGTDISGSRYVVYICTV